MAYCCWHSCLLCFSHYCCFFSYLLLSLLLLFLVEFCRCDILLMTRGTRFSYLIEMIGAVVKAPQSFHCVSMCVCAFVYIGASGCVLSSMQWQAFTIIATIHAASVSMLNAPIFDFPNSRSLVSPADHQGCLSADLALGFFCSFFWNCAGVSYLFRWLLPEIVNFDFIFWSF